MLKIVLPALLTLGACASQELDKQELIDKVIPVKVVQDIIFGYLHNYFYDISDDENTIATALALSPDNKYLAVATRNKKRKPELMVVDLMRHKWIAQKSLKKVIKLLVFTIGNRYLVATDHDEVATIREFQTLKKVGKKVGIVLSPDGQYWAEPENDAFHIRFFGSGTQYWQGATLMQMPTRWVYEPKRFEHQEKGTLEFAPAGNQVAMAVLDTHNYSFFIGNQDHLISDYEINIGVADYQGLVNFTDKQYLCSWGSGRYIPPCRGVHRQPAQRTLKLAYSPNGRFIAFSCNFVETKNSCVIIWDRKLSKCIFRATEIPGTIISLFFTPRCELTTRFQDNKYTWYCFDKKMNQFYGYPFALSALSYSPSGEYVAVANGNVVEIRDVLQDRLGDESPEYEKEKQADKCCVIL